VQVRIQVAAGLALTTTALTACAGPLATPPAGTAPLAGIEAGEIPDGREVTPFDTQYPAIRNLDPHLLRAVQKADYDAQTRGVTFVVNSGWRSKAYQQTLLDQGIEKYGSLEKARQYVNTPEKSTHVSGKAIDIGPAEADDWLIRHGSDYGLCQAYANELWHFELLTTPGGDCPPALPNAAGG
jgi:D-alanyl-D-alanine carboxypeptidase